MDLSVMSKTKEVIMSGALNFKPRIVGFVCYW